MAMARDPGRRPWWKKKRWIAAGILLALAVCFETIPRFPFGPYRLYANLTAEQRAAKIPYDHLSDEATDPLWRGQKIVHRDVIAARARFPHVRDCLIRSERNKAEPDLRLIDWDKFSINEEAEVCLWRIFASYGLENDEARRAWRKFQFDDKVAKHSEIFFPCCGWRHWWVRLIAYSHNGGAVADDKGRIVRTYFGYTIL
jgi:hypothetical protein